MPTRFIQWPNQLSMLMRSEEAFWYLILILSEERLSMDHRINLTVTVLTVTVVIDINSTHASWHGPGGQT